MISVLYVDDEQGLLEVAQIFLQLSGEFRVDISTSAKNSLESPAILSYDAIISDYQMPGMDGIAFLKAVRARSTDIPFILFTGRGREEVVIEAINNGADFYLQKGGDPEAQFAELAHKIKQAVRRKRAEISLFESERRYRDVVETQTEFISRFLPDGTHVFVNDAYCRIFGKQREEIIGHKFLPPIPEEDRERLRQHFTSFSPEHPVRDIEHRVIMPDGSIRWHWWNDHAIFDDAGRITEIQSIGKDITDRKKVEEDLRQSENLYRTIFTTTGAATIIIAPDTTILLANTGWEKLTGVPRADQENKMSWTVFFDRDDAGRMKQYHQDRRKDPASTPPVYESRLIDSAHQVHNVVVHVQMIPGTGNSVASLVDITEQKQAEEALKLSENLYRATFDYTVAATVLIGPDTTMLRVNSSWENLTGVPRAEAENRMRWTQFVHPDDLGRMKQYHVARRTDPSGAPAIYEFRLVDARGETHDCIAYVGVIAGTGNSIASVLDITNWKRAEKDLQKSEERYRSVVNDQSEMICRFLPDGTVTFTNMAYRQYFHPRLGLPEMEGKKIRDLMQIGNYKEVDNFLGSLTPASPVREMERRITGKDGKDYWQQWSVRALFDSRGKAAEYQVVGRDITERKRAEEEIRFKNILLSTQQETSPDGILIVDGDGRILHRNRRFVELWNIPEELAAAQEDEPLQQYVTDQLVDPDAFLSRVRYLYDNREEKSFEELALKDGRVFDRFSAPILGDDGRYYGRVWYFRDMTGRRKAEGAVRESEARLRSFIETTTESVALIDEEGTVIEWNSASEQISGIPKAEALGRAIWDLTFRIMPPENRTEERRAALEQAIRTMLATGVPVYKEPHIVEAIRPDGTRIWTRQVLFPIRTGKGYRFGSITQDITDEKVTETALRESEERYRELADLLPLMVYEMDPAFRITYANRRALATMGYTEQDIRDGISGLSLIDPAQYGQLKEDVQNPLQGIPLEPREYSIIKKDGSRIPVTIYAVPIHRDGTVSGFRGVAVDITERKKMEEELQKSSELLKDAMSLVKLGFWEYDPKTNLITFDESFYTLFGTSAVQEGGYTKSPEEYVSSFVLPEDREFITREIQNAFRSADPRYLLQRERRIIRRDGQTRSILTRIEVTKDAEGRIFRAYGVNQDITELRAAEDALRASEEKFRSLVETSPDLIWETDEGGVFRYLSPQVQTILGYSSEEMTGKTIMDLVPEQMRAYVMQEVGQLITSDGPLFPFEFPSRHRNGHVRVVEVRPQKVTGPDGKTTGLRGVTRDITNQKKAQAALRESDGRFRSIVETSPNVIWETDLQGRFRYISPMITPLLGYTPEEVTEKSLVDMIPEQKRAAVMREFMRYMTMDSALPPLEVPARHRDGHEIVIEIRPAKLTDAGGQLTGFRGVAVDITTRRQAEEALRESEEKFRSLVETSPDMIWEIDPEGKILYVSPTVFAILGYTPEDVTGRSIMDLITETDRPAMLQSLSQVVTSGTHPQAIEVHTRHRNGSEVILEIRPALAGTQRTARRMRGVAVDITERKRAQDTLRESEEKFRSFVETSPDMIWEIDLQGKFRYISPTVFAILGYTPEEVIGKSIADLVADNVRPVIQQALAQDVASGASIRPLEVPARHRDGHEVILEIRPSFTGTDGTRTGLRGVAVDITERKRAEEAIRKANRQLNLLGGITRHDILNKVAVAHGFLKIAGMKTGDPAAMAAYLTKTESAIADIREQIRFTKVYENLGTQKPQWIPLVDAIRRIQVPATITLYTTVQGISVFADPMLERVFFNLLDNSVRHGQRVTEIRVSSCRSGDDLVIVWEDNGVGIPADEKERIFERGFGKNTGLGMFLIREILSLTGITITETGEPGKGARFEIMVPKGLYRNAAEE